MPVRGKQFRQTQSRQTQLRTTLLIAVAIAVLMGSASTGSAQFINPGAINPGDFLPEEVKKEIERKKLEDRKARLAEKLREKRNQQKEASMAGPPGGHFQSGSEPFNPDHGHFQHHASTAAEGRLRGQAALTYSRGAADKLHSQAAILYEQARWAFFENKKKRVETFYARREEKQRYDAEQKEIEKIRDIEGKEELEERRGTEYADAYRLRLEEFNHQSGTITWHPVFNDVVFTNHRTKLNFLFKNRADYGLQKDKKRIDEILATVADLDKDLQDRRGFYRTDHYMDAQNFLNGLKYEAEFPQVAN